MRSWCIPFLMAGTSLLASITPGSETQAKQRMTSLATAAGVAFPLASPEIRIFKADHRLELWAAGKRLKSYPVGLGHRGLADKRRQGDHLTPEGRYYLCIRNAQSAFHLFLGVSYPGEAAAERGLKSGLITKTQRDRILATLKHKGCPPWNTGLGGTVGIHGGGSGADWTWGCIALEDLGIEELWVACPLGTPIIIEP
jgi:hypothetical protein